MEIIQADTRQDADGGRARHGAVSHFLQVVVHPTKQTYLVQLDPLLKLPFAVSVFAS